MNSGVDVLHFAESPRKAGRGFTLAELMIVMVILGEIATFTIPKVLVAQQNARRNAVLKESFSTLNQVLYEGLMTGEICNGPRAYFMSRLNYTRTCTTNLVTEGCWGATAPAASLQGVQLHNGATIVDFDTTSVLDCSPNAFGASKTVYIDWNGPDAPNIVGDDILTLTVAYTNTGSGGRRGTITGTNGATRTLLQDIFSK